MYDKDLRDSMRLYELRRRYQMTVPVHKEDFDPIKLQYMVMRLEDKVELIVDCMRFICQTLDEIKKLQEQQLAILQKQTSCR